MGAVTKGTRRPSWMKAWRCASFSTAA
jgi:hypothetical protein